MQKMEAQRAFDVSTFLNELGDSPRLPTVVKTASTSSSVPVAIPSSTSTDPPALTSKPSKTKSLLTRPANFSTPRPLSLETLLESSPELLSQSSLQCIDSPPSNLALANILAMVASPPPRSHGVNTTNVANIVGVLGDRQGSSSITHAITSKLPSLTKSDGLMGPPLNPRGGKVRSSKENTVPLKE